MHANETHQPLRLGPGNWPAPTGHPVVWLLAAAVTVLLLARAGWALLCPLVLADPRPEVQRFVESVLRGDLSRGTRDALSAYRTTLEPHRQQALAHEVNYLLSRLGCPTRIGFDAAGQVGEMGNPPAPRDARQGPGAPTSRSRDRFPVDALARRFDPDHTQEVL